MEDLIVCAGAVATPLLLGVLLWRLMRGEPRSGPLRLFGINLLVFAFLVSLVFLPLETYYRFLADRSDGLNTSRVSQRWFLRHYHLNNVRQRDDVDYAAAIETGKRRLTFLGDSLTAGHGVADVENRFGNRVRRAIGATWEVQVLAQNGFETGEEIDAVRSLARIGYQFDVVALVYYPNDIRDLIPDWNAEIARFLLDAQSGEPAWLRRSMFADVVYWRARAALEPALGRYHDVLLEAYASGAWEIQRKRLLELRDLCRAERASFVVVTFPFLELLGPEYRFGAVHDQLDRFWNEAGVPHLDLLHTFDGRSPSELVVHQSDAHPNEEAHRLAAEAIARFIQQQFAAR